MGGRLLLPRSYDWRLEQRGSMQVVEGRMMAQEVMNHEDICAGDAPKAGASRVAHRISDPCAESIKLAERELAAFVGAVTKLFGSEQAGQSAEDWLDSALAMLNLPVPAIRGWRQITVAVAARLAARISASPRQLKPGVCADTHSRLRTHINETSLESVKPATSLSGDSLS